MELSELLNVIGLSALALLVAGWLAVSFSKPSARRVVLEWASALAMYVALLSLFLHLTGKAWRGESHAALVAFGFLAMIFASGAVVTLVQVVRSLRAPRKAQASATN